MSEISKHYLIERFVESAVRVDGRERFLARLEDDRASTAVFSEFNCNVVDIAVDWERQSVTISDVLAADSQVALSLDQLLRIVHGAGQGS